MIYCCLFVGAPRSFYLNYLTRWPECCAVAEAREDMCAYIHIYIYTYIYIYIHTHTHMLHLYIHTHIQREREIYVCIYI